MKLLENNPVEYSEFHHFKPHPVLNEHYFLKWMSRLSFRTFDSIEDWAADLLPEFCTMLDTQAALFYHYQDKNKKFNLSAVYPESMYEKFQKVKLPEEGNLANMTAHPQILQYAIQNLSLDEPQQDMQDKPSIVLFVPVFQPERFLGYFEILLHQELEADYFTFIQKLMPLLGFSLNQVLHRIKLSKRIRELESINQAMEASQEAMHENAVKFMRIHQKLTASINYAQKMQKAILPPEELLAASFEDVFIIYEPKDTVSGDFYWYSQIEYTFLAVLDCTGHGVPGAFMSMIGNTLLNEIVNSKRIYNPAKILEMLHEGVRSALNQNQSHNIDGMEACLCRFTRDDQFNMILTYAGAKRPLYYVRDKQLYKLPDTRRSIGGVYQDNPPDFENHTIQLQEGDVLFLSTDGFKDAPNDKRKSLGINTMKNIFENNAHLPMHQLKALLYDTLSLHLNGTAIRDDITLIGIKI